MCVLHVIEFGVELLSGFGFVTYCCDLGVFVHFFVADFNSPG